MHAIPPLPPFPSSSTRASLSPSQLATLYAKISKSLGNILGLSPPKRDTASTIAFVASYSRDAAQEALEALIWDPATYPGKSMSREARSVRARVLLLAEYLASSGVLPLDTLLDISVAYAPQHSRIKLLLSQAFSTQPALINELTALVVPAFREVLASSASGLYGLRKAAQIILCFIRPAPTEARLVFVEEPSFALTLAHAYDTGLGTIAHSYGGLHLNSRGAREPDEWERLLVETKAAILDVFHTLLTALFVTLAQDPRGATFERTFALLFALQELPSGTPGASPATAAPFRDRSLLADYEAAHRLSRLVERTLARANADDARAELLADSLRALDNGARVPGALTIILGSGAPPGIDSRGTRTQAPTASTGASTTAGASAVDTVVDAQVEEVLAILPDHPRAYIHALLALPQLGTVERVVEALLEGTAPPPEQLPTRAPAPPRDGFELTRDRANVFDEDEMDLARVRVGKKTWVLFVLIDHLFGL
jgi:activating signal cointegrator complex subunit 2